MALSQEQKKNLSLLCDYPEQFYDQVLQGRINLNAFKEQFYKTGEGLFHYIVDGLFSEQWQIHQQLCQHIMAHYPQLSFGQRYGQKDSAFSIFLYGLKEQARPHLYPLLAQVAHKEAQHSSHSYFVERAVLFLLAQQCNDLVEDFITQQGDSLVKESFLSGLLEQCIAKDNTRFLSWLMADEKFSKLMAQGLQHFSYLLPKPYEGKKVNILSYAVHHGATQSLQALLENFPHVPRDGSVVKKTSLSILYGNSPQAQTVHPLDIAFKSCHAQLMTSYYDSLSIAEKAQWLVAGKNLQKVFVGASWSHFQQDLQPIMASSEVSASEKTRLFQHLLCLENSQKDFQVYSIISQIIQPLWDLLPAHTNTQNAFNEVFFNQLSSYQKSIDESQIQAVMAVVDKLKQHGHILYDKKTFGLYFFHQPLLAKHLLQGGILDEVKNINLFEELLESPQYARDETSRKKFLQTAHHIVQYCPQHMFAPFSNKAVLLDKIVQRGDIDFLHLLTDEDLKKFQSLHPLSGIRHFPHYGADSQAFGTIIKRFAQCKLDLATPTGLYSPQPAFYSCFSFLDDSAALKNILQQYHIKLNDHVDNWAFWSCVTQDCHLELLKTEISKPVKSDILYRLLSTDHHHVQLGIMMEIYPELACNGEHSILHRTIKDGHYLLATSIAKKFPHLACAVNEQAKTPVSYLIPALSKLLDREHAHNKSSDLGKAVELFSTLVNLGIHSGNKKADALVEKQLSQYPLVTSELGELVATMRYVNMNKQLASSNPGPRKRAKI